MLQGTGTAGGSLKRRPWLSMGCVPMMMMMMMMMTTTMKNVFLVGMWLTLRARLSGVRIPTVANFFSFCDLLFNGYQGYFPKSKQSGHEVDYASHTVLWLRVTGALPLFPYTPLSYSEIQAASSNCLMGN